MNTEIIAVGSELLLGQIANTNAKYLSSELAQLGVNVYYHTVVGDNPERLKEVVLHARTRSNLIIFTGGLGPTKDDLTKETIASLLNKKLVHHEDSLKSIENFFVKINKPMSENNRKQALVIEGSDVLLNDAGMAPGMAIRHDGILYMMFPGPPRELYHMFQKYGYPYLVDTLQMKDQIKSRVLRFFGIGESQLETDILDIIDEQTNPTIAPLAKEGEVTLRVTAKHHDLEVIDRLIDDMEKQVLDRVGDYLYGYDDDTLASVVFRELSERHLTIASAESLTGGMFAAELTSFSGASEVLKGGIVCYTNHAKKEFVHVKEDTLLQHGAISKECAKELAENVRQILGTDIGISFTGVAGPSESENKPVGKVFIGISVKNEQTACYELSLSGSREGIRNRTVKNGFFHLLQLLKNVE